MRLGLVRLAAVVVAFMISSRQYRFFDCNKMATLSFVSGVVTLLLLYGTGEVMYHVGTSDRSTGAKVFDGGIALLFGLGLVGLAGFFSIITHMCP